MELNVIVIILVIWILFLTFGCSVRFSDFETRIRKLEEKENPSDEKFIENLIKENSKLQAKLNRATYELKRMVYGGGAAGEWARTLLDYMDEIKIK